MRRGGRHVPSDQEPDVKRFGPGDVRHDNEVRSRGAIGYFAPQAFAGRGQQSFSNKQGAVA
jgi:hypothetical protein